MDGPVGRGGGGVNARDTADPLADAPREDAPRQPAAPRFPRYECKICWAVYDPALGDELWQVPPGTPFADLPAHWTCPQCSAQRHEFLLLAD